MKHKTSIFTTKSLATALCLLLTPAMAAAQDEQAMTLQQCIQTATANNLEMKAGQAHIDKARHMQGTAYDIDKTSVSLSQDPTSGGSPDNGLTVSQSFDFPTVYGARRRYLKAETEVARKGLDVSRNELVREVSASYYTLLHARRAIQILQTQDSVYSQFVAIATAKQKTGEGGNLELINAQRAFNENRIEKGKAERAYNAAKLTLRQLLNASHDVVPAEQELQPMAAEAPLTAVPFDQTPVGGMYAARKAATERGLSVAKQGYMPSLNVGLTTQMLLKGFNPYNVDRSRFEKGNLMAFEVGVSVPLFWGGQKARVKAAKKDVELAEISRRQAEQSQQKQYADWQNEYQRARRVLDYYTQQGASQARDMSRLSQLAYENGEIGYVEYIQNQKAALDVQLQYANAVNDYNQSVIMLNYLKGNK